MRNPRAASPSSRPQALTLRRMVTALIAFPWLAVGALVGACEQASAPTPPAHPVAPAMTLEVPTAGSFEPRGDIASFGAIPEPSPLVQLLTAPVEPALPVTSPPPGETPAAHNGAHDFPELPATEDQASDGLEVLDSALCTGVDARVPTGVASTFGAEVPKVWAWVKVRNTGPPTTVTMIWRHEGIERAQVSLDVGTSPRWRTWSRKRIGTWATGAWTVETLSQDGRVLDTMSFVVAGTPPTGQVDES